MRIAGGVLAAAGAVGALAVPLLGFPGAFPVLLGAAVILWLVGVGAAAACVAPPRRTSGLAALSAGFLGWALVLVYALAPLWGVAAAACGAGGGVRSPAATCVTRPARRHPESPPSRVGPSRNGRRRGIVPTRSRTPIARRLRGRDDSVRRHRQSLEQTVFEVVAHPRYSGAFMPVWRIVAAIGVSLTPAAIRCALEDLEVEGWVERRRVGRVVEWRLRGG